MRRKFAKFSVCSLLFLASSFSAAAYEPPFSRTESVTIESPNALFLRWEKTDGEADSHREPRLTGKQQRDGATVFEEVHPLSGLVSVGVGTHRGQEIADRGLVVEACETVLETIPVEEACNGGWRLLRPVAGLPAERVEPVLERGTAGDGRLR